MKLHFHLQLLGSWVIIATGGSPCVLAPPSLAPTQYSFMCIQHVPCQFRQCSSATAFAFWGKEFCGLKSEKPCMWYTIDVNDINPPV